MGMAASQARLLTLTSRLHDVELKAQRIESQKIQLATQEDELYEKYCDALDATKIQVAYYDADYSVNYVDATFSSLCLYNENRITNYALKDSTSGYIYVTEEAKAAYEEYGRDKYTFAWAMLGYQGAFDNNGEGIDETAFFVGIGSMQSYTDFDYIDDEWGGSLYMTGCEQAVYNNHSSDPESDDYDSVLVDLYNKICEAETKADAKAALEEFRDKLYSKYCDEICAQMNQNSSEASDKDYDWDEISEEFTAYTQLWEAINDAGGCVAIDDQFISGDSGKTWLQNMVQSGRVTIQAYTASGSNKGWNDTSVATSTSPSYLQEVQDTTDVAKAEAEYEHDLKLINRQDEKYDNELSKLETERTSITTEIDSIKQVRDDNIDRTFGTFS